jgi:transposase
MIPNADIIADRFHVMKLVNQELNTARNSVIKANEENKTKPRKHEFSQL